MRFLNKSTAPGKSGKGRKKTTARRIVARRTPSRWRRPLLRATGVLALAALMAGPPAWLILSGQGALLIEKAYGETIAFSARSGLIVRDVLVEGRGETTNAAIRAALGVEIGQPLLGFTPQTARRRLETIGWVEAATVERRLNGTIYIRLFERKPIALWQRNGRHVLVDSKGVILLRDGLDRFAHLPVIIGDDAPSHAPALLALLQNQSILSEKVEAATWIGGRRWDVTLTNGIQVRLPENDMETAWRKLIDIENRHSILGRDVFAIDLRLPDRLVVQLTPEGAKTIITPETGDIPGRNT